MHGCSKLATMGHVRGLVSLAAAFKKLRRFFRPSLPQSRRAADLNGCVVLDDAPRAFIEAFSGLLVQDLVECLKGGRGHLRLQGLTHVQGGCMVLEPFDDLLQFSPPVRHLEQLCFEHARGLLEDIIYIYVCVYINIYIYICIYMRVLLCTC